MTEKRPPSADIIHLGSDAQDGPLEQTEELDLGYWSTAEFRAIPTERGRKGLKLERSVWRAFGAISERLGMRRTKLINQVLDDAEAQGIPNTASALRSYAAGRLTAELEQAMKSIDPAFMIKLLQEAPAPSIAIDKERRLLRANREFTTLLREFSGEMTTAAPPDDLTVWNNVRLIIHPSIAILFEHVATNSEPCVAQISIVAGVSTRQRQMKIIGVPTKQPQALVGYLVG